MNKSASFVIDGERVSVKIETRPAQRVAPYRTIDFERVPENAVELSITGTCPNGSGQCTDSIRKLGQQVHDVVRLCDIWDRWHLNGMKAGSRAQIACLERHADELKGAADHYTRARMILAFDGLLDVPVPLGFRTDGLGETYQYGSAWLFEIVPDEIVAEASAIIDRLNGKRFGAAPDVDDAPDVEGDVIDSRDVIRRLEIYGEAVAAMGLDPDAPDEWPEGFELPDGGEDILDEFKALTALESDASSSPDWSYGETLISESYFVEYAKQLADDLGTKDSRWPNNHIDWEAAAAELKCDYYEVTYNGETYLIRA